ncbi:non-ribosomal peptide synthetase [Embleya sp. NBC_00888]|uniref:non-ribosomal peptide synthetase n=1 Tax=Embleya sp. NBC_00888 TaxID=2975960 RepID=UPI003870A29C|nr:non-ribosomal peptide synthetase [Embleya sp. NBC_00888]
MPSHVLELIALQVRDRPDALALVASDGSLGYADLSRHADELAHRLLRAGIRPGQVVAVFAPRGLDLGVALLAVLRAGASFCVIDPQYPPDRVRYLWRNSGARAVITTPDQAPALAGIVTEAGDEPVRVVLTHGDRPAAHPREALPVPDGEDAAYTVFTSGSTGGPKAVAMPHRSLDNLVRWTLDSTSTEPLRTLLFAPLGFDVFIQEVFTAWCSGGCLYAPEDEERGDLVRVLGLLEEWGIQRLFLPPVALSRLADLAVDFDRCPLSLREVAAAGEALRITPRIRALFERLEGCRLHNHYGPAETHVAVAHTLTGAPRRWPDRPPIGRPIPGMAAHVLDAQVPGASGELWLAGVGLAHGYGNDPRLTAERFRPVPFGDRRVPAYRTGDLVRRLADGILVFEGRADDQVKIRGYRVEPAEIELVLGRHPAVRECVVAMWEPPGGEAGQLVAYVVPMPGHDVGHRDLRTHVSRTLPAYMVPQHVVSLDVLPLSVNGKIDRRRLPPPVVDRAVRADPRGSELERSVALVWAGVLGVDEVPFRVPFQDVGGTSLSAALVIARLYARFGVRIALYEFLDAQTVTALSALLAERIDAGRGSERVPADSPKGRARP